MSHARISAPILVLALAAAAFAGCLNEPKTSEYHALGQKGSFAAGWAYDGKGVQAFDGSAFLDVSDANNTGFLVVKGKLQGSPFEVHFDHFFQSKKFHDGGIAAHLTEHGATDVGDRSIPQVDVDMAGWGSATVKLGNGTLKDPITGKDEWTAHFMVVKSGVRDNTTGAVYADAEKTRYYDPGNASQGYAIPGDWELHLVLKNQTANGSVGAESVALANSAPGPVNQNQKLFTASTLGAAARFTINVTGPGTTAGQTFTFTIKAPSGKQVFRAMMGGQAAQARETKQVAFDTLELGAYTVEVTGTNGPGGGYDIKGLVIPPPTVVLNFWWEDVTFGDEAATRAGQLGLLDEAHGHGSP